MAKNQREATFDAIIDVLSSSNVSFSAGSNVKSVLTSEHKKQVRQALVNGFRSGTIECTPDFAKTKLNSDTELNKYCSGLISNWIKKDNRLNGNVKHQTTSSGTRVGAGDSQVKELKKLLKATAGTDAEKEVNEALNARLAQIKSTKTAKTSIDVQVIPENLKHLVK